MLEKQSYNWIFNRETAEVFLGAYTLDFGNVAHKALLKRAINRSVDATKRNERHGDDVVVPVLLSDDFVHEMIGELEEGGIYDSPDTFANGDRLLHIVDDWKSSHLRILEQLVEVEI